MNHRFFVPDGIEPGKTIELPDEEGHHAGVVRVREGEEVEVFDSNGRNYIGRFEGGQVVIKQATGNREPATAIALAMSLISLDKFEMVLQKGSELGVASFIPLIADRMDLRIERARGKEERWRKIVLEAVKQSGRSKIPNVAQPVRFDEAIARKGQKILFDADSSPATWKPGNPATLFIGPEGGFTDRELALAKQNGAIFQSLGPRRLRAETAAIAAVCFVTFAR